MNAAAIRVSNEMLRQALMLPEGVRISRLREYPRLTAEPDLEIIVEGEGLPNVDPGMEIQQGSIWLKSETKDCGCRHVHFDRFYVP